MRSTTYRQDQAATLREMALNNSLGLIHRPHVITITSGKGGVGKSTIALNLALKLGEFENNVLLVDADTNLGKLDVMLGVSPTLRCGDILRSEHAVDDVAVSISSNVKLLAGNSGDSNHPMLTKEKQERFLNALVSTEEHFDYVVIDTSAGLTENVIGYATFSDLTVVVSNPEPIAVIDAYAMIKAIRFADDSVPVKVLMNGSRKPSEADDAMMKLKMAASHFLQCDVPYLGSIPYDRYTSEAIVQQQPLVHCYPSSGASLSLELLARHINTTFQQQTRTRGMAS